MTRIWRETGFVENDPWIFEGEGTTDAAADRIVRHFNDFLQVPEDTRAVVLKPADDVSKLAPHLGRLAMIAVAFPAFNDGRPFSQAALLRTRHGYKGEIRAVGDVLIDQIPLMLRCGIDSFAVKEAVALERLEAGRLTGIPLHYQPAARPAASTPAYAWRRTSRQAA